MDLMDFREIGKLVSEDRLSLEYLWKKRGNTVCQSCSSSEFYYHQRWRVRCKGCKKDYWPLQGTRFAFLRISPSQWLSLVKLFELSTSARKASQEVHLSYKTTLRAYDILRRVLVEELAKTDELLKGELEADEAYFGGKRKGKRGRGAGGKTIVYGILERGGRVSVSIVQDVSAESLMTETVKRVRRGSIVYTDKWRGYDSLMFCGYKHLNIDHRYKFKQGKVYINGIEGFWAFAKERLIKHHGISRKKFLFYIKEMEWRYNNRGKDLFEVLVDLMLH
ncbi:MAG TPA: IS1595 family transposase [Methanoregulaceae archaeon]|nr:IS1595 family transposase [Methanoregulaceae archaeon]HQN89115.1 IS1595 family transposase [Methanoregulaceae archaeon]HQP83104.1 IS1595 family transposase [Methanoregulaceae archaeon]